MRIGFIVSNKFQYLQFKELINHPEIDSSVIIWSQSRSKRRKLKRENFYKLIDPKTKVILSNHHELNKFDGEYEMILSQTSEVLTPNFLKTKFVIMQYGLAKERVLYNARWIFSDLALVYGKYSLDKISSMTKTSEIGNPRFQPYFDNNLDTSILKSINKRIDPNKKNIIYLPTFGDLSSKKVFEKSIKSLSDNYNVILKFHHNDGGKVFINNNEVHLDEEHQDLVDESMYFLSIAHLVLTDYSGSIFDALYIQKKVIVLRNKDIESISHQKLSDKGLEFNLDQINVCSTYSPETLNELIKGELSKQFCSDISHLISIKENATAQAIEAFQKLQNCDYIQERSLQEAIRPIINESNLSINKLSYLKVIKLLILKLQKSIIKRFK